MAEGGLFEGALAGEPKGSENDGGSSGADPFAAAVAMNAAERGDQLDPHAAAHLEEQTKLLRLQIRHFDEDRRLAIGAAKRKRFGDRLRYALELSVGALATAVAAGLIAMAWDAAHDHGLVVEAFSVPPDLAARGLTCQVVARQVLDRLTDMQIVRGNLRAPNNYQNNWGDDLKVEIPQTGVSIGELRRYLSDWLGHQTHITGEVYRTPLGLTVTARTGQAPAKSFRGADGELDTLVTQAAEAIYTRTQPYRYALYLADHDRLPEARAVLDAMTDNTNPVERAWAHIGLGDLVFYEGDLTGVAWQMRAALREVPGFAPALGYLLSAEMELGHDEEAWRQGVESLKAGQSIRRDIAPEEQSTFTVSGIGFVDRLDGDYSGAIRQARRGLALSLPRWRQWARELLATGLLFDHDLAGARAAAGGLGPDDSAPPTILGLAALEQGDPAAVALLLKAYEVDDASSHDLTLREDAPWLAIAKARFGDPTGAQAVVATTPLDCYVCVRARGQVAAARGDQREGDRWFAEAIRQGPDLPQALTDRGAAHLAWGDVDGALADAKRANAVSPHNADALKLWGDALARRGRWSEALSKYDEALKYASAWAALRHARNAAFRRN